MPYHNYFAEQLSEHLFVVGQQPSLQGLQVLDCHVYLIVGAGTALAVDAGGGTAWPFVRAVAERFAWAETPITHVLVTHGHGDHARGLTAFEHQGALTVCTAYTAEHLDSTEDADVIVDSEGVLDLGEFAVQVVLTPGHTPGCASYRVAVDDKECLFTGDLVNGDAGLGWSGDPGFDQQQVLASIKRLTTMPAPDFLLTGHSFHAGGLELLKRAVALGESGRWVPRV
ncbi:MAG: MBL fold metallo-hydrolase [Anaerolineae bacterium]